MKVQRRNISEVSQQEKVEIHFKFKDLRKGYAEIAREHLLDNCDIYNLVNEIEKIRATRANNPAVKHVLRRLHINKNRKETKPGKSNQRKGGMNPADVDKQAATKKHGYKQPVNQAMALAFKDAFKNK